MSSSRSNSAWSFSQPTKLAATQPDSDLDVLSEIEAGHVPGLFRLAGMELELSTLLGGRKVDLNTPLCLSRHFRDEVLAEAEPVHAAA